VVSGVGEHEDNHHQPFPHIEYTYTVSIHAPHTGVGPELLVVLRLGGPEDVAARVLPA
jgi:hypothetical protein